MPTLIQTNEKDLQSDLLVVKEDGTTEKLDRKRPSIVVYDTVARALVSYHAWDKRPSFAVFKGELVNVIEHYSDVYAQGVMGMAQKAKRLQDTLKLGPKDNKFPVEVAHSLINKTAMRIENTFARLGAWEPLDKDDAFSTIIPYCMLAMQKTEDGTEIVAFEHCRPYQNGFLINAEW